MSPSERAKQFMPFAALKGFDEMLREKERIVVEKIELSEESKAELNTKLCAIEKNDMVKVVYFCKDEYLEIEGMVSRMDVDSRILKIVNTKISFEDIYDILSVQTDRCE